jgi:hypothetical protein
LPPLEGGSDTVVSAGLGDWALLESTKIIHIV